MTKARAIFYLIFLSVLSSFTFGAYQLMAKHLRDRENAIDLQREQFQPQRRKPGQSEVRTYTQEDIEKARKEGKLPPGLKLPPQQPNMSTTEQIQRTLKTIEDINKINEMNRRLMEQQQRHQNQR